MKSISRILIIVGIVVVFAQCNPVEIQAEEYEYDALNRVTKVTYVDGSYIEYEYDKNGNIVSVVVFPKEEKDEEGEKPPSGGNDTVGEENDGNDNDESDINENDGKDKEPSIGENDTSIEDDEPKDGQEDVETNDGSNEGQDTEETNGVIDFIVNVATFFSDILNRINNWFRSLFN